MPTNPNSIWAFLNVKIEVLGYTTKNDVKELHGILFLKQLSLGEVLSQEVFYSFTINVEVIGRWNRCFKTLKLGNYC